jgi:hypothetical protein
MFSKAEARFHEQWRRIEAVVPDFARYRKSGALEKSQI